MSSSPIEPDWSDVPEDDSAEPVNADTSHAAGVDLDRGDGSAPVEPV